MRIFTVVVCLGLVVIQSAVAQTNFLDATFNPGTGAHNGFVESMALQPDGKILICGNFASFNGQPRSYVARLNSDGSVDTTFAAGVSYWTRCIAVQNDGKVLIGGFFNFVGGQSRNLVARLNANGSLDTSFNPGTGGSGILGAGIDGNANPFVFALAVQTDGKIIIGGNFATYNGVGRRGIARLNSDGSLDTTFNVGSGVNSWVRSLNIQADGRIIVSGWFTTYRDHSFNRLVRVNPDGTADNTLNAYFGDQTAVYTVAPLPDGKVVAGGHTVNSSSVFQQEIVRLNTNGSFDAAFNPGGAGANDKVQSVALQPDGKMVIGGYFTAYNGQRVDNFARLHANGTLDQTFGASVDSWIWTVLVQPDGKVLICGGFSSVNGFPRKGIARLTTLPTPFLFNPQRLSNRFEVSVATQSGKNYTLQYRDSVTTTNWTSLPSVSGDGSIKTLTNMNPGASTRFYRVLQN